jgi:hypothetical protein
MDSYKKIEDKKELFEKVTSSSFLFLENDYGMRRGNVRITNRRDPRGITIRIRYESDKNRIDIGWGINEDGLGILIWDKSLANDAAKTGQKSFVYFEPFVEFVTKGADMPIVPQVYPGMSVNRICEVVEDRNKLFKSSFGKLVERLAEKLRKYLSDIVSEDSCVFDEFHQWMTHHK